MSDKVYSHLKKKFDEIYTVPPNELKYPMLTHLFKLITGPLKFFPFRLLMPVAILITVILYLVLGVLSVNLASILQYGF